jgi:hypothetical protein
MATKKSTATWLFCAAVSLAWTVCTLASETPAALLPEGFFLNGVDGTLLAAGQDEWLFKLEGSIETPDGKNSIPPGHTFSLLPCATLEKMTAAMNDQQQLHLRLWGRITTYKSRNLLFPFYFLIVSGTESEKPPLPDVATEPNINEPGDSVVIPEQVLKMLRQNRTVNFPRLTATADLQQDRVLSDRTGFISPGAEGTGWTFKLDGLGRSLQAGSLLLLPCAVLEGAEVLKTSGAQQIHFRATGIVTEYRGRQYLLLHRTTRLYTNANFAN